MDMRQFLDLFLTESREHLEGIDRRLSALEQSPSDLESLSELYRHAHSLKGMAASMGFRQITEVAHLIEDLLDELREEGRPLEAEIAEPISAAFDGISAMVAAVTAGQELPADLARWTDPLAAQISRVRQKCAPPATMPAAAGEPERAGPNAAERSAPGPAEPDSPPHEPGAATRWSLAVLFAPDSPMAAARALVVLKRLQGLGTVVSSAPNEAELSRGEFSGSLGVSLDSDRTMQALREAVESLADVQSVDLLEAAQGNERGFEMSAPTPRRAPMPEIAIAESAEATLRVRADRLDRVLDGVGELLVQGARMQSRIGAMDDPAARLQWERIERITSRLSRDVNSMRLVPFDSVAHRFVRAARELSRELGRPVSFRVEGREVRLDRAVIESLADPILHMIRNAIGHGIEDTAERRAAGKPVPAVVSLSLERRDGGVLLRLADDGRGMDPDRIRARARELGFITAREAGTLSHEEVLMLVTLPGFSTAERITELSGRGVGMDVVRTRAEKMGGRLVLRSERGAGTTIELRLPLTIAVIRAFIVAAGGRTWAVPLAGVERAVHWPAERDGIAGAFHLADLLQARDPAGSMAGGAAGGIAELDATSLPVPALVIESGGRRHAVAVDRIVAQQEIVVKPLGAPLEEMLEYSGATLLEDGRIALILDLVNLLAARRPGGDGRAAPDDPLLDVPALAGAADSKAGSGPAGGPGSDR